MGLLLAVVVTVAAVPSAAELLARLEDQPTGKVVRMYGDNKYPNFAFDARVEENAR